MKPALRRVILTGGPGAGKTTLLAELARRGHATVAESARELIAERLARGEPPRPDPLAFAQELWRRDLARHAAVAGHAGLVFFDRSAVESLGMVHEASPLPPARLQAELGTLHFHATVFLLPPWQAIYHRDAERDHPFDHAVQVHARLAHWYARCGFRLHEVPPGPVAARADQVLQALGGGAASGD